MLTSTAPLRSTSRYARHGHTALMRRRGHERRGQATHADMPAMRALDAHRSRPAAAQANAHWARPAPPGLQRSDRAVRCHVTATCMASPSAAIHARAWP